MFSLLLVPYNDVRHLAVAKMNLIMCLICILGVWSIMHIALEFSSQHLAPDGRLRIVAFCALEMHFNQPI